MFEPVTPGVVLDEIAGYLPSGIVRVAVDGPPCAQPSRLTDALAAMLALARPVARICAETFWRDASLRLEYGREDVAAYLDWLDTAALRREVLDPVVTSGRYLPSLRDPRTNRSTREAARAAADGTVLIVSGSLLLGRGLPFDVTVHLAVSAAARARQTPAADAWTLPAFAQYDAEVRPLDTADVVIRYDDPRHPALRVRG